MRAVLLMLVLSVSACFLSPPPQSSCDYRPGSGLCTDLTTNPNNTLSSTLMEFCTLGSGKYSTSLCDHSGSLGGCLCATCDNGRAISWYFTDADAGLFTTSDVMTKCSNDGHPFQTP